MSLYGKYIKEKFNFDIIEKEYGFISYQIQGETCHAFDIYIEPEHRNRSLAQKLFGEVEEIAKAAGCRAITGSVSPKSKEAGRTMLIFLLHDFEIVGVAENTILICKELK